MTSIAIPTSAPATPPTILPVCNDDFVVTVLDEAAADDAASGAAESVEVGVGGTVIELAKTVGIIDESESGPDADAGAGVAVVVIVYVSKHQLEEIASRLRRTVERGERRGGGMSVAVSVLIDVISAVFWNSRAARQCQCSKEREPIILRTRRRHNDGVGNRDIDDIGRHECAENVRWD
jgi:hypothetical protein